MMKSFRSFMNEEIMPYANVKSGVMDISDSAVRDQINQLLAGVTSMKFITPYIALERVAKTLANFHIYLPNQGFLEGDSGASTFPIHQYGGKFGQTDDGEVVTTEPAQFSVFFEYRMSDSGMLIVFCEVVDQADLEEIMDDLEAELNDEGEEELDEGYVSYSISSKKGDDKGVHDKFGDIKSGTTTLGDMEKFYKDNAPDPKEQKKKSSPAEKKSRFDEELNEVSSSLKTRYIRKAEEDKTHAERQAGHAENTAKFAQPKDKEKWNKESKWLRSFAAKRSKGIELAKK